MRSFPHAGVQVIFGISASAFSRSVPGFAPAELLDAVLALPELISRIERWGDHATRLDDLEALRGFARAYEAECVASGAPATPSGLLLSLKDADPRVQQNIRDTLMNRKEQVLQGAYYEVARNNAKVVNYLAQQVVENAGKAK